MDRQPKSREGGLFYYNKKYKKKIDFVKKEKQKKQRRINKETGIDKFPKNTGGYDE